MSHTIVTPSFERTDQRGSFQEVLNDGHWEALIRGSMKPEAVMGNHYHKHTLIFFYVVTGTVNIKTVHVESGERSSFSLHAGQGVILRTNESHSIRFPEETEFIMLKSQRYNPEAPDTYPFPVGD
jgi:quercetin dioxygenase-like cupin family protein